MQITEVARGTINPFPQGCSVALFSPCLWSEMISLHPLLCRAMPPWHKLEHPSRKRLRDINLPVATQCALYTHTPPLAKHLKIVVWAKFSPPLSSAVYALHAWYHMFSAWKEGNRQRPTNALFTHAFPTLVPLFVKLQCGKASKVYVPFFKWYGICVQ